LPYCKSEEPETIGISCIFSTRFVFFEVPEKIWNH
jgi:hypothetical protein